MKEVQDGPCNRLVHFGFESFLWDLCAVFFSTTLFSHSAFSKTWLLPELQRVLSCESLAVFLHFRRQPAIRKRVPAGAPAGAGSYWKHCVVHIQYRSKVSYHPLARRESCLERRESRLARALKNWKYGCLNFSWDFSRLMLTVQQQRSKTLRYLTKLLLRAPAPRTVYHVHIRKL